MYIYNVCVCVCVQVFVSARIYSCYTSCGKLTLHTCLTQKALTAGTLPPAPSITSVQWARPTEYNSLSKVLLATFFIKKKIYIISKVLFFVH